MCCCVAVTVVLGSKLCVSSVGATLCVSSAPSNRSQQLDPPHSTCHTRHTHIINVGCCLLLLPAAAVEGQGSAAAHTCSRGGAAARGAFLQALCRQGV